MTGFDPLRHQQEMMRGQQEQMRKLQEEQRRRQMQAAAAQQQGDRARSRSEDPFVRVEREAAALREEHAAGRLSDADFRERLKALMFQDADGVWWMVGQQSGEWYRSEGGKWVRAGPASSAGAPTFASGAVRARSAERRGHPFLARIALAVCLVFTFYLGTGPEIMRPFTGGHWDLSQALPVWIVGVIVSLIVWNWVANG